MKSLFKKITIFILALTFCLSLSGCNLFRIDYGDISKLPDSSSKMESVYVETLQSSTRKELDNVTLANSVFRSVVAIRVQFSVIELGETKEKAAYGSGVVVNMKKEGDSANVFYVITCHHVVDVEGATVTVYLPDANMRTFTDKDYNYDYALTGTIGGTNKNLENVSLVGGDPVSDVAVLKLNLGINGVAIPSSSMVKACLPIDGYLPRVAEEVMAIGNPTGFLPNTVSFGTISYVNRETSMDTGYDMTLLQINTDIYRGSSGGALFNRYGELIGLTNGGNPNNPGINFAIPFMVDKENGINDNGFVNVATQLIATETSSNYGYLSNRLAKFGITFSCENNPNVVEITSVIEGGLAYKAGFRAGDVLKRIASTQEELDSVSDVNALSAVTSKMNVLRANEVVYFRIEREDETLGKQTLDFSLTAKLYIFCDTGFYNGYSIEDIQGIQAGQNSSAFNLATRV